MSSPFVAEIRIFACNFAPTGWATCDNQLLPISQNTALFSLVGTMYGGDGKSTFALPGMDGNIALGTGKSTTGTDYFEGQTAGVNTVTLLQTELPLHTHTISMSVRPSENLNPGNLALGTGNNIYAAPANMTPMAPQTLQPAGGSLPHNNMQPFQVLLFCIAMQGVFPARP